MNSNECVPCIRYKLVIVNFLEYYFYWREFKILKQFSHRYLIQLYFRDNYFPMKSEGKGKIKKGKEKRGKEEKLRVSHFLHQKPSKFHIYSLTSSFLTSNKK